MYSVAGKKVFVLPSFLSTKECAAYRNLIDRKFNPKIHSAVQDVKHDPVVAEEAWALMKQRLADRVPLAIHQFSPYVSYTKRTYTVSPHLDTPRTPQDRYKLAIYLNTLPHGTGGTAFLTHRHAKTSTLVVDNKEGTAVLFDLALWHAGVQHDDKKMKYMLGFRLQS